MWARRAQQALRGHVGARRLLVTAVTEQPAALPSPLPVRRWPSQLEEVTADWLTQTLRGSGALTPHETIRHDALLPGFASVALPCSPLSRVHLLRLDTEGSATPRSCVLKTAPAPGDGASDGARRLALANRVFEREVGFYRALRTERTPLGLPTVHFASYDKASGRAALLLEDCEAAGLVRGDSVRAGPVGGDDSDDQQQGLCADAAPVLVRALAAHHARFWNGAPFALWRWLPEMNARMIRDFEPALCEAALPEALSRFGDDVPAPLRSYLPGLQAAAAGPLLQRLSSGPRTLLHGDARLHNLFAPRALLAGEGEGDASSVRFVDFGDVASGRGAYDVACLLADGMPSEERAFAEHGLLGEYHDALSEGGVTAYSMYDAWEDYRFGVAYSLAGAVATAGSPGLQPDTREWDAARERLRRVAEAAHDLGCASLLSGS